jgi:hypothetical protein
MHLLESITAPLRTDLELARLSRAARRGEVKVPSWMRQAGVVYDDRGRVTITSVSYPDLPQHGIKEARFHMVLEPTGPDRVHIDEIYAVVSFKYHARMMQIDGRTGNPRNAAKEKTAEWNSFRDQIEDLLGIGSLHIDASEPYLEGYSLFLDVDTKDLRRMLAPFASILFDARGWEWLRQHAGK